MNGIGGADIQRPGQMFQIPARPGQNRSPPAPIFSDHLAGIGVNPGEFMNKRFAIRQGRSLGISRESGDGSHGPPAISNHQVPLRRLADIASGVHMKISDGYCFHVHNVSQEGFGVKKYYSDNSHHGEIRQGFTGHTIFSRRQHMLSFKQGMFVSLPRQAL